MSWRFNAVDRGGPFAWRRITEMGQLEKIIEKLAGYETMTASSLSEAGCHAIGLDALSDQAQLRLEQLELDDLDSIYSFRITGRVRVFGVIRKEYVRLLWFDPEHQVCPSNLSHT